MSLGSASQAFGRPELVSERVRERVMAAAKDLGYGGPDPAARHLRIGRTGVLGLIFAERLGYQFTDPAAPAFLRGVARGMRRRPSDCFCFRTPGSAMSLRARYEKLRSTVSSSTPCLGTILASRQPRAASAGRDGRPATRRADSVCRDRRPSRSPHRRRTPPRTRARARRRALLHQGLDREETLTLDITIERLQGYREGLGAAWDEDLVRICRPNAVEPARRAASELLRQPEPPTAILAMSDVLALGALQATVELGIRSRESCRSSASTTAPPPL